MEARFIKSCPGLSCLPESSEVELAVAGRSNCGKSSLINALTGRKGLARTSSKPGRTRELVLFSIAWPGLTFNLVDLPGYGYAKVSKAERATWGHAVPEYVEGRSQLKAMLLLCDVRRGPAEQEADLIAWCQQREIDVRLVLTKGDKLNKSKCFSAAVAAQKALGLQQRPIVVSSLRKQGVEALRKEIVSLLSP